VTTITASPASAGTVPPHAVDPAAVVARTRPRTTITETVSQTLIMAWRALKKMRRNMEQFFDVTIQPLLFTAMFAYLFGGAISGNVHSYLPLLIPGIVAQTILTTCMSTGVNLREDMEKGVFDRFKALPMSRIAVKSEQAAMRALQQLTGIRAEPLAQVPAIALETLERCRRAAHGGLAAQQVRE